MNRPRIRNAYTLPELLLALVVLAVITGATVGLVGQLANLRLENSRVTHAEVVATAAAQAAVFGFDTPGATLVSGSSHDLGSFSIVPRAATAASSGHRFSTVAGGYVVAAGGGGTAGPVVPLAVQVDVMPLVNASESDSGALLLNAATDLNWTTADPALRFRARVTSAGAVTGADYTLHWTADGSDPDASDAQLPASSWSVGNAAPNPDLLDAVASGAGSTLAFTLKVRAIGRSASFSDSAISTLAVTVNKVAPVATLTRSGSDVADVTLADVYTPVPAGANRLRVTLANIPESLAAPAAGWVTLTSSLGTMPIASGSLTYTTTPASPAAGALVSANYDATAPAAAFTAPGGGALWSVLLTSAHPLVYLAASPVTRSLQAQVATVPAVTILPATGTFTTSTSVSITSGPTTPNPLVSGVANSAFITIRYTTDGTAPGSGSTAYSAPFSISASTTVRATNVPSSTYVAFFGSGEIGASVLSLAPADFSPLYLRATGVPEGSLSAKGPTDTSLANHDPDRDSFAGLLLAKGAKGWAETDPTKYQRWLGPVGALVLSGQLEFRFWSAMKDFNTNKRGSITVYLIDRDETGKEGTLIAEQSLAETKWSGGSSSWVQKTVDFGKIDYTLGPTRRLELCLIVESSSSDDMWFAYDAVPFPSVLGPPEIPPAMTYGDVVRRDGSGTYPYPKVEAGRSNTGLSMTSLGRELDANGTFVGTVWRVRNASTQSRLVVLVSGAFAATFEIPALTEWTVINRTSSKTGTHTLRLGTSQIDVKAPGSQTWGDSRPYPPP